MRRRSRWSVLCGNWPSDPSSAFEDGPGGLQGSGAVRQDRGAQLQWKQVDSASEGSGSQQVFGRHAIDSARGGEEDSGVPVA